MRFVFPYYGRFSGIKHTREGNFCRKSGRLLYGHTRLFFDVLSPESYISVCRCAKCGRYGKTLKSTEFSWTWITEQIREKHKDFDTESFLNRCDASFCRRCFLSVQRQYQVLRQIDEIDYLNRKINGALKRGTNQNNRTTSPVSV